MNGAFKGSQPLKLSGFVCGSKQPLFVRCPQFEGVGDVCGGGRGGGGGRRKCDFWVMVIFWWWVIVVVLLWCGGEVMIFVVEL